MQNLGQRVMTGRYNIPILPTSKELEPRRRIGPLLNFISRKWRAVKYSFWHRLLVLYDSITIVL